MVAFSQFQAELARVIQTLQELEDTCKTPKASVTSQELVDLVENLPLGWTMTLHNFSHRPTLAEERYHRPQSHKSIRIHWEQV